MAETALIWQDVVITIGSLLFSAVLIPQLKDCYNGNSVNVTSAVLTSAVLGIFCVVYASLGLWLSAIPFTAVIWAAIAYKSWKNKSTT